MIYDTTIHCQPLVRLYVEYRPKVHPIAWDAPTIEILIFLDSAAKNYPGTLRDQYKYYTVIFRLTLEGHVNKIIH